MKGQKLLLLVMVSLGSTYSTSLARDALAMKKIRRFSVPGEMEFEP